MHPDTQLHQLWEPSFAQPTAVSADLQQIIPARCNSMPCGFLIHSRSVPDRQSVRPYSATRCCLDWVCHAACCVQRRWWALCVQRWGLGDCDASESSAGDACNRELLQEMYGFSKEANDQCLLWSAHHRLALTRSLVFWDEGVCWRESPFSGGVCWGSAGSPASSGLLPFRAGP